MNNSYYLVLDRQCPGSEHGSWEEAKSALTEIEQKYGRQLDARIIGPNTQGPLWDNEDNDYDD